ACRRARPPAARWPPVRRARLRPRGDGAPTWAVQRSHRGLLSLHRGRRDAARRAGGESHDRRTDMTTLLVLYRAPEGGPDALATFESRYRDEHMPLVAQAPGLRATRVWRVGEALGGETDLALVAAMDFDDRAALDDG